MKNFDADRGAQILTGGRYESTARATLGEALKYKDPMRPLYDFMGNIDFIKGQDALNDALESMNLARNKYLGALESGENIASASIDYNSAIRDLIKAKNSYVNNLTKYAHDIGKHYPGQVMAHERDVLKGRIDNLIRSLGEVVQKEEYFQNSAISEIISPSKNKNRTKAFIVAYETAERRANRIHAIQDSLDGLKQHQQMLRDMGQAYARDVVKMPWQKQIGVREAYQQQTADISKQMMQKFNKIVKQFGVDSAEAAMAQRVIDSTDPKNLKTLDNIIATGNKNTFLNWLKKEFTAITGVSKDLENNGINLKGVNQDVTAGIAKNIQTNGPDVAAEFSKIAHDEKKASSLIEKMKELLFNKDYKGVIKLSNDNAECRSLLQKTYVKAGLGIGLGAGILLSLIELAHKSDAAAQESKYSSFRGIQ